MAVRTRRLTGPGRLSGEDFEVQVHYTLLHRSEDIPVTTGGSAAVQGASRDSISGRIELPKGVSVPPGKAMVLTLHDGNKVKVITDLGDKVTGTSGFFR